jgi:hypothetical protein
MKIGAALLMVAGAAAAAVAVWAADADQTIAGPGAGSLVLLIAAAVALSAAGAVTWSRRPDSAVGPLLLCGAATWCAAQLASPAASSPVLFTTGLAFGAAAPAAIALGIVPDRRGGAVLAVAGVGLLGVLSALVFDPRATGCTECPRNLLLVRGDADLYETLQRAGLWLGLAACVWLVGAAGVWLLRSGAAARSRDGTAIFAAAVYLGAVGAQYVHGIPRGYVSADGVDRALWTLQGAALLVAAAWLASEPLRERRARARLARLVVDLETRPEPRGLRDVLARVLRDPGLRLVYPLPDGRRLDAGGRPVSPDAAQEVTELREGDLRDRIRDAADASQRAATCRAASPAGRPARDASEDRGSGRRRAPAARARSPRRRPAAPRDARGLAPGGARTGERRARRDARARLHGGADDARRDARRRARADPCGARR